ncbi:hypothetical protein [Primorskyibacter sp. S87]|uniref:hypothetical protein n=1 Tax=Primorskyibacter sp. S87 TaxID=3415126 RepID=UPI003C7C017C
MRPGVPQAENMDDHRLPKAPDYTTAALTMLWVNLLWIFFVAWAMLGFVPTLVLAAILNHGISRLALARSA